MKRTVVILQPSYLPWLGYFEQITKSDVFVFFDDVQYTRSDWRNRNRIKITPSASRYLTIPIKKTGNYQDHIIKNVKIHYQTDWITSHLSIIRYNYKKTSYFAEFYPKIQNLLQKKYSLLADLCIDITKVISAYLGISHVQFTRSSELKIGPYNNSTDRLIEICRHFQATDYFSGASAKDYLQKEKFENANIKLNFQDYQHPVYHQIGEQFLPYMSIIDLIFNEGPRSLSILSNKV